jgi:hypothetical protein
MTSVSFQPTVANQIPPAASVFNIGGEPAALSMTLFSVPWAFTPGPEVDVVFGEFHPSIHHLTLDKTIENE